MSYLILKVNGYISNARNTLTLTFQDADCTLGEDEENCRKNNTFAVLLTN